MCRSMHTFMTMNMYMYMFMFFLNTPSTPFTVMDSAQHWGHKVKVTGGREVGGYRSHCTKEQK